MFMCKCMLRHYSAFKLFLSLIDILIEIRYIAIINWFYLYTSLTNVIKLLKVIT